MNHSITSLYAFIILTGHFVSTTANHTLQSMIVNTPVSIGELCDKITILRIKKEKLKNNEALRNVTFELETLSQALNEAIPLSPLLTQLIDSLQEINTILWEIEDAIRLKEKKQEFDADFITLARGVYVMNDARCTVKRRINELLSSAIIEEKGYEEYQRPEIPIFEVLEKVK